MKKMPLYPSEAKEVSRWLSITGGSIVEIRDENDDVIYEEKVIIAVMPNDNSFFKKPASVRRARPDDRR
jgi:hypothetical protein